MIRESRSTNRDMSMRHIVAGAPGLFAHRLCARRSAAKCIWIVVCQCDILSQALASRIGCAPLRGCCFVDTVLQKCHSALRALSALCARASRSLLCPLRGQVSRSPLRGCADRGSPRCCAAPYGSQTDLVCR